MERYDWGQYNMIGPTEKGRWVKANALTAALDEIDRLNAAIKRQAGAAKTLRENTLAEVQHIRDAERKEYIATQTLDSEWEANAILTEENERLREALSASRETHCGIAEHILQGGTNTIGIFADSQRARLAIDYALKGES